MNSPIARAHLSVVPTPEQVEASVLRVIIEDLNVALGYMHEVRAIAKADLDDSGVVYRRVARVYAQLSELIVEVTRASNN